MRKLFTLIVFIFFPGQLRAPAKECLIIIRPAPIDLFRVAYAAVAMVETRNNQFEVNFGDPGGGSWGPVQIGVLKLADYNRAHGTNYTLADCINMELSRHIFYWHCSRFNCIDTAILRWNGGGREAREYLKRVKEYINQ